ncbi:MAG: hypothetical protein JU82_00350 [Sulfuricurvum sp. MLSB]|uniref:hypothetical protein n=1 Tax=unclassified Sulfuricurvum TaxID=2632390 RepID=UPI00050294D6|nr:MULTISPECIES: hypothetical protein [unclassified Sulfuricurvum]KFN40865.1 MAG: hypothetical protein JU82_00350 [Sulfuricurvum sp. MLSB]
MNERLNSLQQLIKLSQDDQRRHLNYLAKCPMETRLALFEKQKEIFYSLLQKYKGVITTSDITYAALILAIGVTRSLEKKLTKKSFGELSLDEIRELSASRAVSFKNTLTKKSPTHEKLMGYWAIIRTLRLDHMYSYERIALYLKKKHRFSVAQSTIQKKWKELEVSITNQKENTK